MVPCYLRQVRRRRPLRLMAVGGKPSPEIPKYVSSFEEWGDRYGFSGAEDNDWLLLGFQSRLRVENVSNFYRVDSLPSEGGAFTRNWIYFGIQDIIDLSLIHI